MTRTCEGHKKVALQLDSADRLIARGYIRSGATVIEPDTVVVSGPAKLLAALPSAIDLMVPETKLRSSLKETIEVPLPHPALTVSPPLVNVFVPVEEALEQAVPIQVVIRDIPAGYKPVIDVEKVTCYFQVPASFADTLSFRGVEATISLKRCQGAPIKFCQPSASFLRIFGLSEPIRCWLSFKAR